MDMRIRCIFAGSIVALLLSVTPLAAACELSCAFARADSDCHSQAAPNQSAASNGAKMDGMAMPGMTMRDMAVGQDPQTDSAGVHADRNHPSIGEMGACEKQPCNNGPAISARTSRSVDPHAPLVAAVAVSPAIDLAAFPFHDARDDVAHVHPRDAGPLLLSLRI